MTSLKKSHKKSKIRKVIKYDMYNILKKQSLEAKRLSFRKKMKRKELHRRHKTERSFKKPYKVTCSLSKSQIMKDIE